MTQKQFDALGRSLSRSFKKTLDKAYKEGKGEVKFTIEIKIKVARK